MKDTEYGNIEIPRGLKLVMVFIDRVGFPAVAFILMAWMCFKTLDKMTEALTENTKVLATVKSAIDQHQRWAETAVDNIRRVR